MIDLLLAEILMAQAPRIWPTGVNVAVMPLSISTASFRFMGLKYANDCRASSSVYSGKAGSCLENFL